MREHDEMHAELLEHGAIHLDYGEADEVFLVTIQRVKRRQLLKEAITLNVSGAHVRLTRVEVANHLVLRVEVSDSRSRETTSTRMSIGVAIQDDVGTQYEEFSGELDGDEASWQATRRFRPPPPVEARQVRLQFARVAVRGELAQEVTLAL